MRKYFTLFTLLSTIGFSCTEEPIISDSFQWVLSEFTEYPFSFASFETGDDNALYSIGYLRGHYGVYMAKGSTWEMAVEISSNYSIHSFTVFKGDVYMVIQNSSYNDLWRFRNNVIEKMELNNITDVSQFDGKLIITGTFRNSLNQSYGMAYSTDGSTFIPVAFAEGHAIISMCCITNTENRMFVSGRDGYIYEYNGEKTLKTDPPLRPDLVDEENNFYVISTDGLQVLKRNKEKTTWVGSRFNKSDVISRLFFKDNYLIAVGNNMDSHVSVAFYFDDHEWKSIPTTNYFRGAFEHKGKLLAFTSDGIIVELVKR